MAEFIKEWIVCSCNGIHAPTADIHILGVGDTEEKQCIATLHYSHKANARLIASAPKLYEALKDVKDTLRAGFSHNPEIDSAETAVEYLHGLWEHCQKVIETALALVEGKE